MKTTGGTIALVAGVLMVVAAFIGAPALAQSKSTPAALSTNWVGYLVVGKVPQLPIVGRRPVPEADERVQIGLRSDGVIVWRSAAAGE